MKKSYKLQSKLWIYPGESANWHFMSVPQKESVEIKKKVLEKKGFGSVRVTVTIGKTSWQTSIFPEKRSGTYLLPVKADVRKKEHLLEGDRVAFTLLV